MADRKRTNAEIDILNQFLKDGETPIPYELEDNNPPVDNPPNQNSSELSEEEKIAAQKKLDDETEAQKLIDAAEEEKKKTALTTEVELDDEKVLAYFKNKKGKEVTSIEDLLNPKIEPTEEEKNAAKEKREAEKFAFGLSTGKFSKKELEDFITDSKNPVDLVLSQYAALQRQKDPTLTDADIEAEFEDKFNLSEDKESRQYIAGQSILNSLAEKIIKEKHSKILNLENEYSVFETSQTTQRDSETKIATQTPLYTRDIEQVRSDIKKVSIPISKEENFEIDIDEKIVDGIITKMLDKEYATGQISKGWDKDNLKQIAQTSAILENLPTILRKYADAEVLKAQAGTRGIPPTGRESGRQKAKELTEDQKKALAFAFPEQPAVAN